jgi:hypothetical protein
MAGIKQKMSGAMQACMTNPKLGAAMTALVQ